MSNPEVGRRYGSLRAAMARDGIDAVVVSGSEYTGFDGAVLYYSGFQIVHRYCYVLLPLEGEPALVFPTEARWVGYHQGSWIEEKAFADCPGEWLRERARDRGWRRLGVFGLDYVMNVRDYRALAGGGAELVPYDAELDLSRAVKSEADLDGVRQSVAINEEGFWITLESYAPGKTEAAIMAPASARFVELGCGRHAMNMLLKGPGGSSRPEFTIPSETRAVEADDLLLYSLEIAGPSGFWAEVSRPIAAAGPSAETRAMMEAYEEYYEAAQETLRDGASAHEVHVAVSRPFRERGFALGHVTGHSIGMTMIEHPRIGERIDVELHENMVFSMHPHVIVESGACLYMQDTYRVGSDYGEPLAKLPLRIFDGTETQP